MKGDEILRVVEVYNTSLIWSGTWVFCVLSYNEDSRWYTVSSYPADSTYWNSSLSYSQIFRSRETADPAFEKLVRRHAWVQYWEHTALVLWRRDLNVASKNGSTGNIPH